MTDEELELKKQEFHNLCENGSSLREEQEALLENENVKRYADITQRLNGYSRKWHRLYTEIREAEQERCPHPAWYFLGYSEDTYEGRVYWTCECIVCGKRLEDVRSRDYPGDRVIWKDCGFAKPTRSDMSYREVADKWIKFMEDFPQEDKTIEEKGRTFTKMMNPSRVK